MQNIENPNKGNSTTQSSVSVSLQETIKSFCRCHLHYTKYIELSSRLQIAFHPTQKRVVTQQLSSERHREPPCLS